MGDRRQPWTRRKNFRATDADTVVSLAATSPSDPVRLLEDDFERLLEDDTQRLLEG